MRQITVVAQTSLDGLVAGTKGEFDHFLGGEENLAFVCGIIDSGDAVLAGRVSFQMLDTHWPTAANKPNATTNEIKYSNWYNAASKFVVSATLQPEDVAENIQLINHNLLHDIKHIKDQPGKDVLIFGSPTLVNSLLELDIIDCIWLIVHPVIFGKGIPLFKAGEKVINFELARSSQLSNGTLCNKYVPRKKTESK